MASDRHWGTFRRCFKCSIGLVIHTGFFSGPLVGTGGSEKSRQSPVITASRPVLDRKERLLSSSCPLVLRSQGESVASHGWESSASDRGDFNRTGPRSFQSTHTPEDTTNKRSGVCFNTRFWESRQQPNRDCKGSEQAAQTPWSDEVPHRRGHSPRFAYRLFSSLKCQTLVAESAGPPAQPRSDLE